jgi:hypothetical protein
MKGWGALITLFLSSFGAISWADDDSLSSVELYHGYGSVVLKPEASDGGLYIFDREDTGVRFMSTFNYSYGNPFMIMDLKSRDILYRKIADDSGERFVTFWKVGEGDGFFEFEQREAATILRSRCPLKGNVSPLISKTIFYGHSAEGLQVELEEIHPLPHGVCSLDKFKYIVKWKSGDVSEKIKSEFETNLKTSLYRFFGIHDNEFEIHSYN